MPPKKFEGKFGIPSSHTVESQLTSALYRLPDGISPEHVERITQEVRTKVDKELQDKHQGPLSQEQLHTLHLKLARHFQTSTDDTRLNMPTLIDALVESPRFLSSDKGSLDKLFEMHEMKTLQRIAEIRRRRAETISDQFNPYEALFETTDGKYYLARLLNMPHLEEESTYMDHCVGTSDSYVNKMKRGEVEILSFRDTGTHNPVVTIEYDLKSKRLLQVRGEHDTSPELQDSYFLDLLEALERMAESATDQGNQRTVDGPTIEDMKTLVSLRNKIDTRENLSRDDLIFLYEINRPISCLNDERDPYIGQILAERNPIEDAPIVFDCTPEQMVYSTTEIKANTKAYIGALDPGIFDVLPEGIKHVYTKFPEELVKFRRVELGTSIEDGRAFETAITVRGMQVYHRAAEMLANRDFKVVGRHQTVELVELSVAALGFSRYARYDAICARATELGLELCPAEVGPQLRLQYTDQPQSEYLVVAMKAISGSGGYPRVFTVCRFDDGLWLDARVGEPAREWDPEYRFVFLRPRK